MAKNFDDFVLWLRENPEYKGRRDSSLKELVRKMENSEFENQAQVVLAVAMFSGEMTELELRMYHEWVNL